MRALQNFFFERALRREPGQQPDAAARLALKLLGQLGVGSLHVVLPGGTTMKAGHGAPCAHLTLTDWSVFTAAFKRGDIGFAEAYIEGKWHTDDLPSLLSLLLQNRALLDRFVYGSWWGRVAHWIGHQTRRNSKAGSRRNIHAHYDLGNAFYGLWLDPSMTYSSALYRDETQTLEQAQMAKYRRIVAALRLPPDARVLEIGCGWGGFACVAAAEAGARVTGLTLSTEQLAYANARIDAAGLAPRIDLHLRDYRDTVEQYDAIASIEMFEAVGEQYWDAYFACIARSLKAGGRACVQTIVIDDALFDRYRKGSDFIQQYVFPGGMLPSRAAFTAAATRAGLAVVDTFAFGADYGRTLHTWRTAFRAKGLDVRAQGFDERFIRLWDFYLCYCEAAFANGNTDVVQFTLTHAPAVPEPM